ncbi:disease resistance protein RGA2 [Eucalyptus grandis]|uniref:disease resistance protein RGA2 n=1 Tax=Eucalyptus grandis TaxID=71139 RepID=UPI00192EE932|nr:disease resistance protein RGA2 [Eucalyptus grandis]
MSKVVSSILGPLLEKLTSSAVEEIQLVGGVKDDQEKLKNKLEMIEKVLANAEQKQTKEEAMRLWLSRLKDFCYDVEDVLDEFEARALWRQARLTEYLTLKSKNYEFNNLDLIQLWISNGLIQSSGNNKELEEIGRQYLEELWSRSFFDFVREDYPFLFFRMHDLIHELAISVAQTELSNMKVHAQDISPKTRHISFPNPSRIPRDELHGCLSKLSRIRTIMLEDGSSGEFLLEMCISRFKHLRVLWLDYSSFDLLPSSIGSLKHLRFLSLWGNWDIKKLPDSICKLHNLQCLDLGLCMELEELPANIKNLISLPVLCITTKQQHFPERGIGCLTSLRWLLIASCENLEALFDDIQLLTSLRKMFIVHCPKNLKLPEDESNEPRSMLSLQSFIFEGLPELVYFPRWLEGSTSTLRRIKIVNCPKLRELPEWLQNCSSLRTLEIKDCPRLSSLPHGIRRIPTLTELWITNCGGIE